jgi:hypothetical protein
MALQRKVYAQVFSRKRGIVDGTLEFMLDYVIVTGAVNRSGKTNVIVTDLSSETNMKDQLRDALEDYLNVQFAPEIFQSRDILGPNI